MTPGKGGLADSNCLAPVQFGVADVAPKPAKGIGDGAPTPEILPFTQDCKKLNFASFTSARTLRAARSFSFWSCSLSCLICSAWSAISLRYSVPSLAWTAQAMRARVSNRRN